MILQALVQHYEDLLAAGEVVRPGWARAKVSYGLDLSGDGRLLGLLPLQTEQVRGKKAVIAPRMMEVPMPGKHASGISANFLFHNSGYLLGADGKGKPQRTAACFAASKALHLELLDGASSPAARAVAAFFENWDPAAAASHPALAEAWEELMKGANLIFWYKDAPVCSDPEVRSRWQARYDQTDGAPAGRCLVTGQRTALARLHPNIQGVQDAHSAGAPLVSFNADAFCSYGHEQGANAPVGTYAAFAYTTALNHLLTDREHVQHIGDSTVVCWAAGGQSAYQDLGMAALYGDSLPQRDLQAVLGKLARGEAVEWDDTTLDPEVRFYVLGLAPNAARLSVRFFWQNRFGDFAGNLRAHYERLRIVRPSFDKRETLSVRSLLWETVNRNSRDGRPMPQMAGDVLRAVLTNTPYPATLLHGVTLRIRAERDITRGRAAILKAYYCQNKNDGCPEEVLTVELNEQSRYLPYVLGQLFSVLEAVQNAANPDITVTIKDTYFSSASSTPAVVFPRLLSLAQKHLRKLKSDKPVHFDKQTESLASGQTGKYSTDKSVYFDKQIGSLMEKIREPYPARLSLPEQGAFQIGYYHQTQKRYTKKEEQ